MCKPGYHLIAFSMKKVMKVARRYRLINYSGHSGAKTDLRNPKPKTSSENREKSKTSVHFGNGRRQQTRKGRSFHGNKITVACVIFGRGEGRGRGRRGGGRKGGSYRFLDPLVWKVLLQTAFRNITATAHTMSSSYKS